MKKERKRKNAQTIDDNIRIWALDDKEKEASEANKTQNTPHEFRLMLRAIYFMYGFSLFTSIFLVFLFGLSCFWCEHLVDRQIHKIEN